MPDTVRPPFRPSDLLPWWPVVLGLVVLAGWLFDSRATTNQVLGKLSDLQTSMMSISKETAVLPRLSADVVNLERRLTSLEKANETQDDRIGRLADSIAGQRNELSDVRGEVRGFSGVRPPTQSPSGRPPR